MYFDAVVVEVKTFLLLFRLALAGSPVKQLSLKQLPFKTANSKRANSKSANSKTATL
jgi:hypothetical protein